MGHKGCKAETSAQHGGKGDGTGGTGGLPNTTYRDSRSWPWLLCARACALQPGHIEIPAEEQPWRTAFVTCGWRGGLGGNNSNSAVKKSSRWLAACTFCETLTLMTICAKFRAAVTVHRKARGCGGARAKLMFVNMGHK